MDRDIYPEDGSGKNAMIPNECSQHTSFLPTQTSEDFRHRSFDFNGKHWLTWLHQFVYKRETIRSLETVETFSLAGR